MTPKDRNREIVEYYEETFLHYRLVWFKGSNLAMHFGYWDPNTNNHADALLNANRVLAERIGVQPDQTVLDAGCGVGGSAIWLAKTFGARVTGITLSQDQVRRARRYAQRHDVAHLVDFSCRDYTQTRFRDETFDVVWAIESVCHAVDKSGFVKEARRVLKAGGKLIVADGWARQRPYTGAERRLMDSWLSGWAVPTEKFSTPEMFLSLLAEAGFERIEFTDCTERILPSSRRLYRMSMLAYPLFRLLQRFRLRSEVEVANLRGARDQYLALRNGLWTHGFAYAEKA